LVKQPMVKKWFDEAWAKEQKHKTPAIMHERMMLANALGICKMHKVIDGATAKKDVVYAGELLHDSCLEIGEGGGWFNPEDPVDDRYHPHKKFSAPGPMKLLTKEIQKALPKIGSTKKIPIEEKTIVCKFFTPDSNWTWYAVEGNKEGDDFVFFGLVHGFEKEWGYFSLSELESATAPMGLHIERDKYWEPKKVKDLKGFDAPEDEEYSPDIPESRMDKALTREAPDTSNIVPGLLVVGLLVGTGLYLKYLSTQK